MKREVALFTRAWIEIKVLLYVVVSVKSPSSRGRGLKFCLWQYHSHKGEVALFTRAWIEIDCLLYCHVFTAGRPLHEGVD